MPENSPSFFTRILMAIPAKPNANIPTDNAMTFHSMGQNYDVMGANPMSTEGLVIFFVN